MTLHAFDNLKLELHNVTSQTLKLSKACRRCTLPLCKQKAVTYCDPCNMSQLINFNVKQSLEDIGCRRHAETAAKV